MQKNCRRNFMQERARERERGREMQTLERQTFHLTAAKMMLLCERTRK